MRPVAWSLFGFAIVVAAVALGAMTTPAVDSGLSTVAVAHHAGLTRRQVVDLAIAVFFALAAVAAAVFLASGRGRAEAAAETGAVEAV